MWAQKRKQPGISGNGPGGFDLKKKPPVLAGTGDIDALLAESEAADEEDEERERQERERERQQRRRGGCGCGG